MSDSGIESTDQLRKQLDARIYGLVNRGADICTEFQSRPHDDGGYAQLCDRCGYNADTHLLRDVRSALIREARVSEEGHGWREPELPKDAPAKGLSVGEDKKACAAWVAQCQKENPTYWTTDRMMTLLFAHRHNMMRAVEHALKPEWDEASRRVFEDGNSGWTHVVYEAVQMLRDRANDPLPPPRSPEPSIKDAE